MSRGKKSNATSFFCLSDYAPRVLFCVLCVCLLCLCLCVFFVSKELPLKLWENAD